MHEPAGSPLQRFLYGQLHARSARGLTPTQRFLFATILLAVAFAILGTEPNLPPLLHEAVDAGEYVVGAVFLVEYVARIYSVGLRPDHAGLGGRLRYMLSPVMVLDLLALLPFLLGAIGAESLVLRLIRVLRLLALTRLVRYSEAMRMVIGAVYERRYELFFAMLIAGLLILFSSAALYVLEGDDQPKVFGSIPRAMWWSVITLTTVGYGDVYPVTIMGKVFAALTAIGGIGMIAMPTGILAASFSDGFARARKAREAGSAPT